VPKEVEMGRPAVYKYLDYRVYLKALFEFKKHRYKYFSYRVFSRDAGFSSPNFLKLVIDGHRNLTSTSITKVAKGFKLNKKERDFFEALVFMNQSKTHDERNHYYQKMLSLKGYDRAKRIEKASYEYFSKWYYPAIREIVMLKGRPCKPEQIAEILNPKITWKEAEKALHLLEELGLVKEHPEGHWEQCDKAISTGPEIVSLVIANYHKEMLKLASESLERFPAEERDITALTISVKRKHLMEIKGKIASLRKELLELAVVDTEPDMVYQINFQVFPLANQD